MEEACPREGIKKAALERQKELSGRGLVELAGRRRASARTLCSEQAWAIQDAQARDRAKCLDLQAAAFSLDSATCTWL